MEAIETIGGAIGRVAKRVGPATAGLGRGWQQGSGVLVGDGLVLTSAHNLRRGGVGVKLGGERQEASLVGALADHDVAVLRVERPSGEPVEWGDPDSVEIGTPVIALADPGGRGLRATAGFVSAAGRNLRGPRGRRIEGTIEHTAPLPRGSSGGPLVDLDGRLLGINSLRLEGGLIVALPASAKLRDQVEAIARGESVAPPLLGVAVATPRVAARMRRSVGLPERAGLLVREVEDDSPAARAGLARGDLLVRAGDSELDGIDALHEQLDGSASGGSLAIAVVRGNDEREVTVELGEKQ